MNKDMDIFKAAGRREPYGASEGLLAEIQERVMLAVKDDARPTVTDEAVEAAGRRRRRTLFGGRTVLFNRGRRPLFAAMMSAAVAAVIAAAVMITLPKFGAEEVTTVSNTDVDKAFANLSVSDQNYIIELYEISETLNAEAYMLY